MSNTIGKFILGRRAESLDVSDRLEGFSRVALYFAEDKDPYVSGTDTGRTLEAFCPWATQKMADNILQKIRGYRYQPFSATKARLDPAAELGDAVSIGDTYGMIASMTSYFGPGFVSDISSPHDEEIDHEYPYKSPTDRKYTRQIGNTRAELAILSNKVSIAVTESEKKLAQMAEEYAAQFDVQSKLIAAKVSSKSENGDKSFGWELIDDRWTVKSNGKTVFEITKSGAEVYGKITAVSGKIGNMDIGNGYLSTNGQTVNGDKDTGLYLGDSGFRLGSKTNGCHIAPNGDAVFNNLTANNGTFKGNVYAGNIKPGGGSGGGGGGGYLPTTVFGKNTVPRISLSGDTQKSLNNADWAYRVIRGEIRAELFKVYKLDIIGDGTGTGLLNYQGHVINRRQITYKDERGTVKIAKVLTWV